MSSDHEFSKRTDVRTSRTSRLRCVHETKGQEMTLTTDNPSVRFAEMDPRRRKVIEALQLDDEGVVRFFSVGEHPWQLSTSAVASLFGIPRARAANVLEALEALRLLRPLQKRYGDQKYYLRSDIEAAVVFVARGRLRFIASLILAAAASDRSGTPKAFVFGPVFLRALLEETGQQGWTEGVRA